MSNVAMLRERSRPAEENDSERLSADEAAVWRVVESEALAVWTQDPEGVRALHTGGPHEQWWGWSAGSGVTVHRSEGQLTRGWDEHFKMWPEPNWYLISQARRENKTIRIVGDVAWVTFDEVLDTDKMPGYVGPGGCTHIFFLLERRSGEWKIAFTTLLDEQFGQTAVPTWQIGKGGEVLRQNAAAARYLRSEESDVVVTRGHLRMRDAATDRRLRDTITAIADPPGCLFVGTDYAPIVCDPGDDSPVRVWWVVARSGTLFVSFNDPTLVRGRIEVAARTFGLSPAQHRLTASISSGLPLTEAAKLEGIRVSTARTQLQRIYEKVGVRGQPALVQALLTAASPG